MFWSYDNVRVALGSENVFDIRNKVATAFVRGENGDIHLRYHCTNVITFHPDNTFTLSSGGFRTRTTLARLREFGPLNISQENGKWILSSQEGEFEFFDGIKVDPWGLVPDIDEDGFELTLDNQIRKTYL